MKRLEKLVRRILGLKGCCEKRAGTHKVLIPAVRFENVFPGLYEQPVVLQRMAWRYGHLSHDETLVQLAALARYLAPRRIFEFGTFDGRSALNMALNQPEDGKLFTLDLSTDGARACGENEKPYMKPDMTRALFREKRVPAEALRKIELLQGDSKEIDLSAYRQSMDLVFVDGGHDRETAAADSVNAFLILRPGGIILWDDYTDYWPEVREVIDLLSGIVPLCRDERTSLVMFGPGRSEVSVDEIRSRLGKVL